MDRQEILNLKKTNPIKFLETLPLNIASYSLSKLSKLGLLPDQKEVKNTSEQLNVKINNILSDKINLKYLTIGGIIYIIGKELQSKLNGKKIIERR